MPDEERNFLKEIYFWYFWDRRNHVASNQRGFIESSRALQIFYKILNPKEDKIVSLNYDIMTEEAITYVEGKQYKYNYGIEEEIKDDCIEILKPMGSINYLRYVDGEEFIYGLPENGEEKKAKIGQDEFSRKLFPVNNKESIYEVRTYSEMFKNIVYRPSIFDKDNIIENDNGFSNKIWGKVHDYINECEEIFVIGYNLRKIENSDISPEIKRFIESIMKKGEIYIIDPDYNNTYEKFCKEKIPHRNFIKMTFGSWVANKAETDIVVKEISNKKPNNLITNFTTFSPSATGHTEENRGFFDEIIENKYNQNKGNLGTMYKPPKKES